MRKIRVVTTLVGVGVASVLVLAGCSSGGGKASSPTPSTSSPSGAQGFNAGVTSIVRPSTTQGGTLNVGALSDCDSWDPARTYYGNCWVLQRLFTRTLLNYPGVPGQAGATLMPDLATALPTVSDGGRTWTFTMQSGLKWQDGTPLTSADVKYGMERIWATDVITGGPYSYFLCLLDTCDAKGVPTYSGPYKDKTGAPMINGKPSIDTPSATKIVFHLARPFSDFAYLLTLPNTAPVPKAHDTGSRYTNAPFSSGPFKVSNYSQAKSITFVRNDQWTQSSDTVRHPLVDKINLVFYSNADDLDNRLRVGQVDFKVDGGVQPAFLASIIQDPTLKANADNPVSLFTRYMVVFPSTAPLNNIHCREAVFYALDKAALVKIRGGQYGGELATTLMNPAVPGAEPTYNPFPSGPGGKGDIPAAKAALAACGHPSGFSTVMAFTSDGLGPKLFASVQSSLARAGIVIAGASAPGNTFYQTFIGSPAKVKQSGFGLALAGWGSDFPSGYGFYNPIANGNSIQPIGNTNYPSLNVPTINAQLENFETLTVAAERSAAATKLDQSVMAQAVYLPFQNDKSMFYRTPRTTNIYMQQALGSYYDIVNVGVSK